MHYTTNPPPMRRTLALCLLACSFAPARADIERTASGSTVDDQDAISIRGIFDFQLPKIIMPESLRFTLNPMLGDFARKDYVRIRAGWRYAPTKHVEVNAEVVPYFDNFGGRGTGGLGIAEYRLGTKLAWPALFHPYVDTAFGATATIPAPGAPAQLSIGTARLTPYVAFSRDLKSARGLGAYLNIGYEIFDSDPDPTRLPRYRPVRDNLIVTPGLVLHRAPWHYTVATSLRTTALDGDGREYFSVLPAVSFEVPSRWVPRLPGRLVVGAGYEAIFFGDEIEHRITSRFRWDLDWAKAARNLGTDMLERMPWRDGPGAAKP